MPSLSPPGSRDITARVRYNGEERSIAGNGNGPIDAFVGALARDCGVAVAIHDYHEHAVSSGSKSSAVAYVSLQMPGRPPMYGVAMHSNISAASLCAVVSAVNRLQRR